MICVNLKIAPQSSFPFMSNVSMHLIIAIPTPAGCRNLGQFLRSQREVKGWSLDRLCSIVYSQVKYRDSSGHLEAYYVTKGTLSQLEQGKTLNPDMSLLAAISAVGFAKHPADDRAYTAEELRLISCEHIDPTTGTVLAVSPGSQLENIIAVVA